MQDSVVEHLVCTQLSPSSPPAPVLGTAVHYPPNQVKFSYFPFFPLENENSIFSQLICLLSDYRLQCLALSPPRFSSPPPLLLESGGGASPLKKTASSSTTTSSSSTSTSSSSRESFEHKIAATLRREATLPR